MVRVYWAALGMAFHARNALHERSRQAVSEIIDGWDNEFELELDNKKGARKKAGE